MLINLEPFGRLGNRLFFGAHLLAFGLRFDVPTLNLGFAEYAPLFPWMEGNAALAYPWRETGNSRMARALLRRHQCIEILPWSHRFRYWGDRDFNFDETQKARLLGPLREGRDVYLRAWLFRGFESVTRFRPQILEVFRPSDDILGRTGEFLGGVRSGGDKIVGVHVRWEDYRGTPFFLDQQGFVQRMRQVRDLSVGERVRFVLFSNETLPSEGWGDLDVIVSPSPSILFDLQAMSACDALMGPPSTFSGWASFYGAVPLLPLSQEQPAIRREDFQVCRG